MRTKEDTMNEIEKCQHYIGEIWGNMQSIHDEKYHYNMYGYFAQLLVRLKDASERIERKKDE